MAAEARFFAEHAWLGGWERNVLLIAGADGCWRELRRDVPASERAGAQLLGGPVLPGLANGHSHAFQRAIVGLTERSATGQDDFWAWRDRMYAAALKIGPQQLEAVAAHLYAELLQGGYTQVCEFHYLHNDLDGRPYADPAEMAHALLRAAQRVGIGLTLLPTLYMRSGFGASGLRDDQRRFASSVESVLRVAEAVALACGSSRGTVHAGVALHSLRAVDAGAMREIVAATRGLPLHIHIAEQQQEVSDALASVGQRPIEWLLDQAEVDGRWNLVHATQAEPHELAGVQARGAAIVLCPTTEANLGDGVFDLPTWLRADGRWSVGSDSQVTRSWPEELRLLEYSQRLLHRRRNVAAGAAGRDSTAAVLFDGALAGGSAAAGLPLGGLQVGQRADFLVVDAQSPGLAGIDAEHWLDALVFSSPQPAFSQVFVAGREVVPAETRADFVAAMRTLWGASTCRA